MATNTELIVHPIKVTRPGPSDDMHIVKVTCVFLLHTASTETQRVPTVLLCPIYMKQNSVVRLFSADMITFIAATSSHCSVSEG